MANVSKKVKQKPLELTQGELIERDAAALALMIYDIYQDKKRKEKNDDLS